MSTPNITLNSEKFEVFFVRSEKAKNISPWLLDTVREVLKQMHYDDKTEIKRHKLGKKKQNCLCAQMPWSSIEEGNGDPLQYSCLENPRDGGVWWAAVYGVTQSRTRLKWLSSSSRDPLCGKSEKTNWKNLELISNYSKISG